MWLSSNNWEEALENQKFSHDEINSSLKSGNARCHSVQDILSSSLVLKKL